MPVRSAIARATKLTVPGVVATAVFGGFETVPPEPPKCCAAGQVIDQFLFHPRTALRGAVDRLPVPGTVF